MYKKASNLFVLYANQCYVDFFFQESEAWLVMLLEFRHCKIMRVSFNGKDVSVALVL